MPTTSAFVGALARRRVTVATLPTPPDPLSAQPIKRPQRPPVEWDDTASPVHVLHGSILQMQRTLDQCHRLALRNDRTLRVVLDVLQKNGILGAAGSGGGAAVPGPLAPLAGPVPAGAAPLPGKSIAPPVLPAAGAPRVPAAASAASAGPSGAGAVSGVTSQPPSLAFLTHLTSSGTVAPTAAVGEAPFDGGVAADAPRLPTGLVSSGMGLSLMSGDFPPIDASAFGGGGSSALPPPLGGSAGRSLSHLLSRHTSGPQGGGGGLDVGVMFDQAFQRITTSGSAAAAGDEKAPPLGDAVARDAPTKRVRRG